MSLRVSLRTFLQEEGFDSICDALEEYGDSGSVPALCEEGCEVEPDGICPHGNPSFMLAAGVI